MHVRYSLDKALVGHKRLDSISLAELRAAATFTGVAIAKSPVRIDIAGGWSDTPPCSYEAAGAVLNVAVLVDGMHSVQSLARFTPGLPIITMKSIKQTGSHFEIFEECRVQSMEDFNDAGNPAAPCSLLKAVLITLGFKEMLVKSSSSCNNSCHIGDDVVDVSTAMNAIFGAGIEVVCVSSLPPGSGMGGSSIVAAAVISAVGTLLGLSFSKESLVYLVSLVEQEMTTGGGWQDQVAEFPRLHILVLNKYFKLILSPKFVSSFMIRLELYTEVSNLAHP